MSAPGIDLERLCAHNIEQLGCEGCDVYDTAYPPLWKFDVDGVEWRTDRFWMLPASMLSRDANAAWKINELPVESVVKARTWIRSLATDVLDTCTAKFAPTYAGVLTEAGLTARSLADQQDLCALVDPSGNAVGLIMPVRLDRDSDSSQVTTIPTPDAVLETHKRIATMHIVHDPDAVWCLAVALTQTSGAES